MTKSFNILPALIMLLLSSTAMQGQNSEKGDYASLAIDRKDGELYGWAINYNSQSAADERALGECEKNGGDCHVVLRFKGGCGVYVVERGNGSLYGWGTANTRTEAENRAMEEARARGGNDLVVRVWGCNDGSLQDFEEVQPNVKGVYNFYMTYAGDENKVFVTRPVFHPGVAQKNGDRWVWTSDAKKIMYPAGKKFMDAVVEDLYGFLGDLKDQAIEEVKVDWKGKNELEHSNSTINLSNAERLRKMEAAVESVHELAEKEGAKLIIVDVK